MIRVIDRQRLATLFWFRVNGKLSNRPETFPLTEKKPWERQLTYPFQLMNISYLYQGYFSYHEGKKKKEKEIKNRQKKFDQTISSFLKPLINIRFSFWLVRLYIKRIFFLAQEKSEKRITVFEALPIERETERGSEPSAISSRAKPANFGLKFPLAYATHPIRLNLHKK